MKFKNNLICWRNSYIRGEGPKCQKAMMQGNNINSYVHLGFLFWLQIWALKAARNISQNSLFATHGRWHYRITQFFTSPSHAFCSGVIFSPHPHPPPALWPFFSTCIHITETLHALLQMLSLPHKWIYWQMLSSCSENVSIRIKFRDKVSKY